MGGSKQRLPRNSGRVMVTGDGGKEHADDARQGVDDKDGRLVKGGLQKTTMLARLYASFRSAQQMRLIDFPAVAPYYRTPYVIHGYRPPMSILESVMSLVGKWHNEMLNCWTHVLGALLFVLLALHSVACNDPFLLTLIPVGGVVTCIGSVVFHTIGCCSHRHYQTGLRCDAIAILGTAVSCQILPIFAIFKSHDTERKNDAALDGFRWVHSAVLLLLIAANAYTAVFVKHFHSREFRRFRSALFIVAGLYFVVPIAHGFTRLDQFGPDQWFGLSPHRGIEQVDRPVQPGEIALEVWLATTRATIEGWVFLLIGATLVVLRIPERWAPGKLDFGWWSHPIWHICTVLQGVTHFLAFRYVHMAYNILE
eukprot:ANDGO_01723.mRNA.1 ADIPOR-like receptor SPBC12C2.09c